MIFVLAILFCFSLVGCGEQQSNEVSGNIPKLFVSADADAEGEDGTEDHPFSTLEKARDAVRKIDRTGCSGIEITVSGTFRLSESFILGKEDSGTAECPIRWISNNAEITGGAYIPLSELKPIDNDPNAVWFDSSVKDRILSVDLKNYGITPDDIKNSELVPCADNLSKSNIGIYSGDSLLTLARYPNDGLRNLGMTETDNKAGTYTTYYAGSDNDRVSKWHAPDEVYILGYFSVYWSCDKTRVLSFDYDACKMTILQDGGYEPKKTEGKYYWYNIPEELDMPGEYYISSDAILYYYPLEEGGGDSIIFPLAKCDLIQSTADRIVFDGFTLKDTRGKALDINGNNITVKNCRIERISNNGMTFNGNDNLLEGCEIARVGYVAVKMDGGDVDTLTSSDTVAANNYIHSYAESKHPYNAAFDINGCGITIRNNEIAYSNHVAIRYAGNNHMIEYNDIHDVCRFASDSGAISSSRTLKYYGNILRFNYIHDIGNPELKKTDLVGIYWDSGLGGQTACGNIFSNIYGYGMGVSGGPDNTIKDNIFINCIVNISYDQRYYDRAAAGQPGSRNNLSTVYDYVRENEIFSNAFPTLIKMINEPELDNEWFWAVPARSVISGNVAFDNTEYENYSYLKTRWYFADKVLEFSTVENNVSVGTYSGSENAPSLTEAVEQSGLDIDISKIGRLK